MNNRNEDNKKYSRIDSTEDKRLTLNVAELIFLDDSMTLAVHNSEYENMMPIRVPMAQDCTIVSIDLLDKIGRALVKCIGHKSITIKVSDSDLYVLRELAQSHHKSFGYHVGIIIKHKVLHALYGSDVRFEVDLNDLLKDIDLGETG